MDTMLHGALIEKVGLLSTHAATITKAAGRSHKGIWRQVT